MEKPYRIEFFGGLRLLTAERVVTRFQTQKTGALLACLAYHLHKPHSREILIEMLWPGSEPQAARNSLSVSLSSLRHLLEPPGVSPGSVILANRRDIALNSAAIVTDAAEFDRLLNEARQASGALRIQCLSQSMALYHASLLPGYYEDWIVPEQRRRAEQYFQAARSLTTALVQAGDLPAAVVAAHQAVLADPLREEVQRDLMQLLNALRRPEEALQQYLALEKMLRQEMNAAPEPVTQRLARQIEASIQKTGVEGEQRPLQVISDPPIVSPTPVGTVTFLLADYPAVGPVSAPKERLHSMTAPVAPVQPGAAEDDAASKGPFASLCRLARRSGGHRVAGLGGCTTFAFTRSSDALFCAVQSMRAIARSEEAGESSTLRIVLHTGEIGAKEGNPRDRSLQLAGQILLSAQAGQILCTEETACFFRRDLEPGLRLRDLGIYHLSEPSRPERLYQIVYPEMSASALAPLRAQPGYQSGLPLQFTRFFGREREIARLMAMLEAANSQSSGSAFRLITLTGPGGSGKTRLSLEVANHAASSQQDALWFVSLADLTDPRRIPDTIADAMRLPRFPGSEPLEQVVEALSRQRSLLLLDNFEHLVEEGVEVIQVLLERTAGLRCLVTSRRALRLVGEVEFAVSPLPVPVGNEDPEALLECDSVRLFMDRAQQVLPDFQVTAGNVKAVAELCARLEGIPLALELAAARAQALTPAQMLARIAHRFDLLVSRRRGVSTRQQTLRAALDWGYELLSPELQRLFARLSVFRAGWTLDAAETIMGAAPESAKTEIQEAVLPAASETRRPVLDDLSQLRECSLLQAEEHNGEMRFRLLETLREYAAEKLPESEYAALRARHASFYLAFAEEADQGTRTAKPIFWLERLEAEHDNLRAALAWTEENDIETGLRLLKVLSHFWGLHGHLSEGREWLKRILARSGDAPPELRIAPLKEAGSLAMEQGDYAEAQELLEQSLSLSRFCNDDMQTASALHVMGVVALYQGDGQRACALHSESLAIMRRIGCMLGIAAALMGVSQVACNQGDYARARSLLEEALPICRDLEDRRRMARLFTNLGKVHRLQGDYDRATECCREALEIQRALGDRVGAARVLGNLGNLADDRGEPVLACTLHRESLEILRELGDKQGMTISLYNLASVTQSLGDYPRAIAYHQESLKLCLELNDRLGVAYSLEELSGILLARQKPHLAAQLYGAAEAIRDQIDSPVPPLQQPRHDAHHAALRKALGVAASAAALSAGRSLSWQQAATRARSEKQH